MSRASSTSSASRPGRTTTGAFWPSLPSYARNATPEVRICVPRDSGTPRYCAPRPAGTVLAMHTVLLQDTPKSASVVEASGIVRTYGQGETTVNALRSVDLGIAGGQ